MILIKIKRVYESYSKTDGCRVLIDRLWPRGIKKGNLILDYWIKELAPSTELRKWFDHKPERYNIFSEKYYAELDKSFIAENFISRLHHPKIITLLYASSDKDHNHALILKRFLSTKLNKNEE